MEKNRKRRRKKFGIISKPTKKKIDSHERLDKELGQNFHTSLTGQLLYCNNICIFLHL